MGIDPTDASTPYLLALDEVTDVRVRRLNGLGQQRHLFKDAPAIQKRAARQFSDYEWVRKESVLASGFLDRRILLREVPYPHGRIYEENC